ncbi:MAG: SDR family oxidoreductase [Gammaproteobacteria bacterium]
MLAFFQQVAQLETVPYCTAQAGLIAYVRSMGPHYAKSGINMSCILPGAIITTGITTGVTTSMTTGAQRDQNSQSRPKHVDTAPQEHRAIQGFGARSNIAKLAVFLSSDYASFIVGSTISQD